MAEAAPVGKVAFIIQGRGGIPMTIMERGRFFSGERGGRRGGGTTDFTDSTNEGKGPGTADDEEKK
jgi:hypothetical protein